MSTSVIQRQYDDLIADHYDVDPQSVVNDTLNRALYHVRRTVPLEADRPPMSVLDLGIGTGLFLEKLKQASAREIRFYGLDISERMIGVARKRIPDLNAAVDDAANIDQVFVGETFDLICTHYITGFVPITHLAPRIFRRLKPGGYWSFLGGTSAAYPELRRAARSLPIRIMFPRQRLDLSGLITPADAAEVVREFAASNFEVCSVETLEPELDFQDFDSFMEFAYRGGWLTPFIEELGLHKARPYLRRLFDRFVFPITDCHKIAAGLARKPPHPI